MDIKEKITSAVNSIVAKLKGDENLLKNFNTAPVKTVEKLIGKDLPDDQIEKVVDLVKAKLTSDKVADKADDIKDKLKGIGKLFG